METTKIETAITWLSEKVSDNVDEKEAMAYSQAALNMAHVLSIVKNVDKSL